VRVAVDEAVCIGSGQCEQICPEVFTVDVVAKVMVPSPEPSLHEAVREAVEMCPTEAITFDD
jgi:ferredoxin